MYKTVAVYIIAVPMLPPALFFLPEYHHEIPPEVKYGS